MYLSSSSKSYEKKYRKYKNKYQILKSNISGTLLPPKVPLAKVPSVNGGTQYTLLPKVPSLNGGDCDPLPNPEEEDFVSRENLLDLCPEERITIQDKCYEVRSLYRWIITDNHNILPSIQTEITVEEKQRLIQAYEALPKIPNILTRDKLIQIYPNLLQVTIIDLSRKGYTDIALGTFSNLPNLQNLYLDNNQIRELQPNIFNNLPELRLLGLENNQIRELQPNIFNNLPALEYLILENNQIQELLPGIFNNLPALKHLDLENNHQRCLWQIQELQPHSYYGLSARVRISI